MNGKVKLPLQSVTRIYLFLTSLSTACADYHLQEPVKHTFEILLTLRKFGLTLYLGYNFFIVHSLGSYHLHFF